MLVKSVGVSCVCVCRRPRSHYCPYSPDPSDIPIVFHCDSTPVVCLFHAEYGNGGSVSPAAKWHGVLWQALILQDAEHPSQRARESKAFGHLSPQREPAASVLEGLWGQSKGCWLWQAWKALCSFEPRGLLLQFGLFACWMDTAGLMMEIIVMLMEMTCLVAI